MRATMKEPMAKLKERRGGKGVVHINENCRRYPYNFTNSFRT